MLISKTVDLLKKYKSEVILGSLPGKYDNNFLNSYTIFFDKDLNNHFENITHEHLFKALSRYEHHLKSRDPADFALYLLMNLEFIFFNDDENIFDLVPFSEKKTIQLKFYILNLDFEQLLSIIYYYSKRCRQQYLGEMIKLWQIFANFKTYQKIESIPNHQVIYNTFKHGGLPLLDIMLDIYSEKDREKFEILSIIKASYKSYEDLRTWKIIENG